MVKVWKLGLTSYDTALKIQVALARKHLDAIKRGVDADYDTLLIVEHKPVFTVGKALFGTNLLYKGSKDLSKYYVPFWEFTQNQNEFVNVELRIRDESPKSEIFRLRSLGAEFKKTNRGGLITFHGPGQLVVYPIINLKHFKTSVKWYVNSLEETVIRLCDDLGVKAYRSPHTGVWVDDNKIAAIGIHASRYVTTHGISLNCDNDLSWFDHIDPCGIEDKGVTSLSKVTGIDFPIEKVTPMFLRCFNKVFDCKTNEELDVKVQEEILKGVYSSLLTQAQGA